MPSFTAHALFTATLLSSVASVFGASASLSRSLSEARDSNSDIERECAPGADPLALATVKQQFINAKIVPVRRSCPA